MSIIVSRTNNQLSRQTSQNIKLCFDEFDAPNQKKLIKQSIFHICCSFTELAAVWNHPVDNALARITSSDIDHHFSQSNKPKIMIAPHHGSWELFNLWLAHQEALYALYKPSKKKSLDEYLISKRTRNGATLIPASTSGLRILLKALKKDATCMILPDQKPAKKAAKIDADFFNHGVSTTLLIKNLALKTNCDIYIGAITRKTDKGEYSVTIKHLERENFIADDKLSAGYLNHSIEQFIKPNIEQYQWAYRRFYEKDYSQLETSTP